MSLGRQRQSSKYWGLLLVLGLISMAPGSESLDSYAQFLQMLVCETCGMPDNAFIQFSSEQVKLPIGETATVIASALKSDEQTPHAPQPILSWSIEEAVPAFLAVRPTLSFQNLAGNEARITIRAQANRIPEEELVRESFSEQAGVNTRTVIHAIPRETAIDDLRNSLSILVTQPTLEVKDETGVYSTRPGSFYFSPGQTGSFQVRVSGGTGVWSMTVQPEAGSAPPLEVVQVSAEASNSEFLLTVRSTIEEWRSVDLFCRGEHRLVVRATQGSDALTSVSASVRIIADRGSNGCPPP